MTAHTVAVVGGGPMCTYAVAHLAAVLPDAPPAGPVRIVVLERGGRAGAGEVHSDTQTPVGYLNRVTGQIAFAPDESSDPPRKLLPAELRPTFQQWCAERYARTGHPDFLLRADEVPRRYVHGLALREMFLSYVARLDSVPGVRVEVRTAEVTSVRRTGGAGPEDRFVLRTADGAELAADQVLFVTGHSWNRPAPGSEEERLAAHAGYVPTPYPLAERLTERAVPPGRPVAVRGLGLTAIDVLLQLTEGRGGTFVPDEQAGPHGLRYVPAGREPSVVVAVSPSGVPVSGRPVNRKVADPSLEHTGVFFTVDAVRTLRATAGARMRDGRLALDFDLHLFPLVVLEMAWVHNRTLRGDAVADRLRAAVEPLYRDFLAGRAPWGEAGADALIAALEAPLDGPTGEGPADGDRRSDATGARFDWRAVHDPLPAGSARTGDDGADWARRTADHMRRDHLDALEGNLRNAVKAACDGVWRDLRPVFAEAVDFGGLTPDSHRRFVRTHMRYYNRLSNGAGTEPMRKVLALLDAGLIDLSVGPEPEVAPAADGRAGFTVTGGRTGVVRRVDTVVEGRVHPFDARRDVLPLYRSLLDEGLVQLWRNTGPARPDGTDTGREAPDAHRETPETRDTPHASATSGTSATPATPGTSATPGTPATEDPADFVPGALHLDDRFHPVLPGGGTEPRLTFLGAPAEGLRVFQQSAARPYCNSSVLAVAAEWAEEAVRRMPGGEDARTPAAPHHTADATTKG
ncbi:FAD/NAD(P)-binding protein [Streptomyces sp. XM83C]|uniref:FAD/NAD(P)-binding protein n=1 Tax=Streptomyces sp. XM83C TaxID=2929781 RepID=UPI001FF88369|nr:FAD/NAD(P)-binding protein [Streptomyces sp. XM83C]MCK1819773.1 FAD/NAD(P)-binding protein [Streptomyces sp. XM83C]